MFRFQFLQRLGRTTARRHLTTTPPSTLKRESSLNIDERLHRIYQWRKEHALVLTLGGAIGGGITLLATFYFIIDNPTAVEKRIVSKTADAFSRALNFEGRKKIYLGLPDVTISFPSSPSEYESFATNATPTDPTTPPPEADFTPQAWAKLVTTAFDEAESSWWLMAKVLMRKELISEACKFDNFEARLSSFRQVLPACMERDILVEQHLSSRLVTTGWLESKFLQDNPPSSNPVESCDMRTRIFIMAVAFFPRGVSKLVQYLDGMVDEHVFDKAFEDCDPKAREAILKSIRNLKEFYIRELDSATLRDFCLQRSLSMTINCLKPTSRPYQVYVQAIEDDLLSPLRRDARVTEDILEQVKRVFLALPSDIQARILLRAIRHPLARATNVTPEEQAIVVRDLLSAGGVVAVKLAQMLAEDPKIPSNYRRLLGKLRDDNEPMTTAQFWAAVPPTVRSGIVALGPILGVGSVKQVHRAKFKDGSEYAVAVLRDNVENEALASLDALEASDELGVVAKRLSRLVFGEFNLFGEGEALGEFATTSIGKHPKFRVVRVIHHSPKCLIEEIAHGPTLATVLAPLTVNATAGEQAAPSLSPDDEFPVRDAKFLKRVKDLLTEYHRAVFEAFIGDGMIHSDIHLGNAVLEKRKGKATTMSSLNDHAPLGLVLFDVGQWERIGKADTKALLWVLGSISSIERRSSLREVALTSLSGVSSLRDEPITTPDASPQATAARAERLRQSLEKSFSEAIAPFEDGTLPDQRQAYMLFLRACERNGVSLPKGAFSVAKMIDGMLSQTNQFRLHDVAEELMETFLRKNMNWWEASSVFRGTMAVKSGQIWAYQGTSGSASTTSSTKQ